MVKIIVFLLLTAVSSVFSYGAQYSDGCTKKPCNYTDLACISEELAERSHCDPMVWGSVPNEVHDYGITHEAPNFNATFHDKQITYKNLDKCYISAFLFEENIGQIVIGLTCVDLRISAQRTLIQHNPREEDKEYCYESEEVYPGVIFTAQIPNSNAIDLDCVYVFPYLTEMPSEYKLYGENFVSREFYKLDKNDIHDYLFIYVREYFSDIGGRIFRKWINNMLCDFNCYEHTTH